MLNFTIALFEKSWDAAQQSIEGRIMEWLSGTSNKFAGSGDISQKMIAYVDETVLSTLFGKGMT